MEASQNCVRLVQRFEGCERKRPDGRYEAYPDPATGGDPWTIGWGTTGRDVRPGTVWTREQCDARLARDLAAFSAGVGRTLGKAPTTRHQFDALVSFAYNVGLGKFAASRLLRKHKAGDHEGAAAEFARWNKAAGKVLPGLVRRRAAEARLYAS